MTQPESNQSVLAGSGLLLAALLLVMVGVPLLASLGGLALYMPISVLAGLFNVSLADAARDVAIVLFAAVLASHLVTWLIRHFRSR